MNPYTVEWGLFAWRVFASGRLLASCMEREDAETIAAALWASVQRARDGAETYDADLGVVAH